MEPTRHSGMISEVFPRFRAFGGCGAPVYMYSRALPFMPRAAARTLARRNEYDDGGRHIGRRSRPVGQTYGSGRGEGIFRAAQFRLIPPVANAVCADILWDYLLFQPRQGDADEETQHALYGRGGAAAILLLALRRAGAGGYLRAAALRAAVRRDDIDPKRHTIRHPIQRDARAPERHARGQGAGRALRAQAGQLRRRLRQLPRRSPIPRRTSAHAWTRFPNAGPTSWWIGTAIRSPGLWEKQRRDGRGANSSDRILLSM